MNLFYLILYEKYIVKVVYTNSCNITVVKWSKQPLIDAKFNLLQSDYQSVRAMTEDLMTFADWFVFFYVHYTMDSEVISL